MAENVSGFNQRAVFILSIIQLTCGVVSFIFAIAAIAVLSSIYGFVPVMNYVDFGFWLLSSILYTIAGILGPVARKQMTRCSIIALMVMCILSSVFAGFDFFTTIGALVMDSYSPYQRLSALRAIDYCMFAVLLLEMIASIVCASYCCKAVCCTRRSPANQVVVYAPVQSDQAGQPIVLTSMPNVELEPVGPEQCPPGNHAGNQQLYRIVEKQNATQGGDTVGSQTNGNQYSYKRFNDA